MSSETSHTDLITGPGALVAAITANYACGHCNSETSTRTDEHGALHLDISHDDGCPVLAGTLSAVPDTLRALVSDTFRAGR